MSFLSIHMLWLFTLIPILVLIYILIQRRRRKYAVRFSSLSLVKVALGRGPSIRRHIPAMIFLFGVMISLLALARPAATIITASQQGTIILAIDVSRSMDGNDVKPSRLEAAKAAARAFIERQPQRVYIGIVAFSDTASLIQVPTAKHEQVLAALNRLEMHNATAIGQAILTSLSAISEQTGKLEAAGVTGKTTKATQTPLPPDSFIPAAIVLLSDGQNNVNPAPVDVVNQASSQGVRIYTVGLGTTSGTVISYEGHSMRVLLDEAVLKQIAQQTQGRYFQADNENELINIYTDLGSQLIFKPQDTELTACFTGAAVMVLLASGIISLLWFNRIQ